MGHGRTGDRNWNAQRDKSVQLEPFENAAFALSCKIVFPPLHSLLTLDDELYGILASKSQVKLLSNRKDDKEWHCVDALAEPYTHLSLHVIFRRRGQTQGDNVEALFSYFIRERGSQNVHGVIFTAERGYGKMKMLQHLLSRGVCALFAMPEHFFSAILLS
jgi:hypothetical protein